MTWRTDECRTLQQEWVTERQLWFTVQFVHRFVSRRCPNAAIAGEGNNDTQSRAGRAVTLPAEHPKRRLAHDEVHSRPSEPLETPARISYFVLFADWPADERDWQPLADLAERYEAIPPKANAAHYSANFGSFRLRWERHTEFSGYLFIADGIGTNPFEDPVVATLPDDWLSSLPGQLIYAANLAVVDKSFDLSDIERVASDYFAGNVLAGGHIAGGSGLALTDFRIHRDGFSRILLQNLRMSRRQCGRNVQRLLELETYRVMALLALPVARGLSLELGEREQELARLTSIMAYEEPRDEQSLLERLTLLQAAIENRYAESHYRFSAATAYHELVGRRIAELREERLHGVQGFYEFTSRRLDPAMATCRAMKNRQEALAVHVARATQLLSTRVDIARHAQNQNVLESMNRRAKLQLRLQQTVEGLTAAAVTYYTVGLIDYAAQSLIGLGFSLDRSLVVGASIPVVALAVIIGLRRLHALIGREEEA